MFKQEIKKLLEDIYDNLEMIQESAYAEDYPELLNDLGEAMGSLDNALTDLKRGK